MAGWMCPRKGRTHLRGLVALQAGLGIGIELGRSELLVLAGEGLELEGGDVGDDGRLDFDSGGSHCGACCGWKDLSVWKVLEAWCCSMEGCFKILRQTGNSLTYKHPKTAPLPGIRPAGSET